MYVRGCSSYGRGTGAFVLLVGCATPSTQEFDVLRWHIAKFAACVAVL